MKFSKNLRILLLFVVVMIVGSGIYLSTAATKPVGFGQTDSVVTVVSDTLKSKSNDTLKSNEVQKDSTIKADTTYQFYQKGEASWYGDPNHKLDPYHGRTAASGVKFDTYKLWAAHKTLPFGSIIRIIRESKKDVADTVIVQIVDRGPFAHGRIIDLSWASAQKIHMSGCSNVRLEKILVNGQPLIKDIEGTKVIKEYKKKSKKLKKKKG
jgi:rare lipoprotein A